jgi:hypothetical protein
MYICKRERLKSITLNTDNLEEIKYISITLNLDRMKREDEIYKLNMIIGNETCRCSDCNPNTGGGNMICQTPSYLPSTCLP